MDGVAAIILASHVEREKGIVTMIAIANQAYYVEKADPEEIIIATLQMVLNLAMTVVTTHQVSLFNNNTCTSNCMVTEIALNYQEIYQIPRLTKL